jgi:excisionase family DNA binding protein
MPVAEVPHGSRANGWSEQVTNADLLALPPAIDIPTAAQVLGVGRSSAYELIRRNEWPTPVLRLGRVIRIPRAPLLALLGVHEQTS